MQHVKALLIRHLSVTPVSLRLGHAAALTPHRGVIHSPRAASLPLGTAKNIPRFELCQPHSARHSENWSAVTYEKSCAEAI